MRQPPPRPRLIAATLTTGLLAAAGSLLPTPAAARPDIGAQRAETAVAASLSASSSHSEYPAGNAGDGNPATYWESANNAFPQWIQADLGAASEVNRLVLKLPPGWGTRTQTLSVQNSTNGSTFSTLVAATGYSFDPASGNTVTVDLPTTNTRYLRLHITANNGWPAGQLSELEVHGPAGGPDNQVPTAPTNLATRPR